MSNIDRVGGAPSGSPAVAPAGSAPSQGSRTAQVADRVTSADLPSASGTAVLNLTSDQAARIRVLLVAMRLRRAVADDVRNHIISILTGGQRRMIGAAYFILSVRV